jgi:hypothetical protein
MPKIGELVATNRIKSGLPPVVLQVQPTGYVEVTKPEELKEFEDNLHSLYGIKLDPALRGVACETCSCCSDDCGYMLR